MQTGPLIALLDTWLGIMQELNADEYTRIMLSPHGSRVGRIGELKKAGLVVSRLGVAGGHRLTMPISDIPLGKLLAIREMPSCPTTEFLTLYRGNTLGEILSWHTKSKAKWVASLGVVTGVLSNLSCTIPIRHREVYCEGISGGYTLQVLYRALRHGLTAPVGDKRGAGRNGVVLTKPFDKITIGDITPLLTNRYTVYNALVSHSASVKLVKIMDKGA